MKLDTLRFESGLKLLKLLDNFQAEVVCAAWVINSEDWWDFCVVTPLIDKKGPLWLATQFATIHKYIKLPEEISPLNLVYLSPRNTFFHDFHVVTMNDINHIEHIDSGMVSEHVARKAFPKLPQIKGAFVYRSGKEENKRFVIYPNGKNSAIYIKKPLFPGKYFAKQVEKITQGKLNAQQAYV